MPYDDRGGEAAAEALDHLREQATEVRDKVVEAARERARQVFKRQQEGAADGIGNVAGAIHEAADRLAEHGQGGDALRYADELADRVSRFADRIRETDLDDLVGDVEVYARRQPEVFLGGALFLGFLAARFAKNAELRREQRSGPGVYTEQAVQTASGTIEPVSGENFDVPHETPDGFAAAPAMPGDTHGASPHAESSTGEAESSSDIMSGDGSTAEPLP